jgi:gamma-glutamyltranspeptidase/glutathione hydrolase
MEIFLKSGEPYAARDVLVQKDKGKTLRIIAQEGPDVFYTGEIGEKIARDLEENDSLIAGKDWETPKVKISDPLSTDYRGYKVTTNTAPGGGLTLIQELNILEGYNLGRLNWRGLDESAAMHMHYVASAFKASQHDRATLVGDPDFVDVPIDKLTSKEYAAEWRVRIDTGERISIPRNVPKEGPDTTHLCVVDRYGNAVSMTHSLAAISGVVTPGLGFLYNACMNCFDPHPGRPNSLAPGKSRLTGLSPSMVFKDGELELVIGAPGGNRIIGGVLQGIINIIDHGMSPVEAVYAPRIECQWLDIVDVSRRIPNYLCDELSKMPHRVEKDLYDFERYASVQAISIDRSSCKLMGAADPRSSGIALSE